MSMLVNGLYIQVFSFTKYYIVCHFRNIVECPIILTNDDGDDGYKNLDTSMNIFRENGNKLKPDSGESTGLVKHFVSSDDRYGYLQ